MCNMNFSPVNMSLQSNELLAKTLQCLGNAEQPL